jgi:pyruvate kinase
MQALQVLLEEPIRLGSILESSSVQAFSSLTKIIGTLGPKSRSVESIESMLRAGMSVARFDFSWGDEQYHQETLENLKQAVKNTRRLCAVMLDTVGPELYVVNDKDIAIQLVEGEQLILSPPDNNNNNNNNSNNSSNAAAIAAAAAAAAPCSTKVLSVNYDALAAAVKPGDTIFIGQYLFTGSEDTSVWLEVTETRGTDVICKINNTATLTGTLSLQSSRIPVSLQTLH